MSDHLAKTHYPDHAQFLRTAIRENVRLARDTYRLRFDAPPIAQAIWPGQFLMLRLAGTDDPLLGRPLALYDTVRGPGGAPVGIDIVYMALGKMTRRLAAAAPGTALEVWGPLGNGFPPSQGGHLVMVAGGIGYTPFLALAAEALGKRSYGQADRRGECAEKATLCFGVRSAEYLPDLADFSRLGVEVLVATEDGSAGHKGLVTEFVPAVVQRSVRPCRIVACGPEPMLEATAHLAQSLGVPCLVSLESPMACGMGICFSCVVKVRDADGGWDYRRACVDGPVFDAERIQF